MRKEKQPLRASAIHVGDQLTEKLLRCGMAAGPIYVVVGLSQALLREGFDMRRHALSLLSNGDLGWIQISNFVLSGLLVIAGAIGLRKVLHGRRGGTWAPILLAAYGAGLIGAGVFVADPASGFPPGTPMHATELTRHGLLHFVFGGLGFWALAGATLVLGRRFWSSKQTGWASYSAFTGAGFLISFAMIASGLKSPAIILTFYVAVLWVWVWHTALYAKLSREEKPDEHYSALAVVQRQSRLSDQ